MPQRDEDEHALLGSFVLSFLSCAVPPLLVSHESLMQAILATRWALGLGARRFSFLLAVSFPFLLAFTYFFLLSQNLRMSRSTATAPTGTVQVFLLFCCAPLVPCASHFLPHPQETRNCRGKGRAPAPGGMSVRFFLFFYPARAQAVLTPRTTADHLDCGMEEDEQLSEGVPPGRPVCLRRQFRPRAVPGGAVGVRCALCALFCEG